MLGNSEWAEQGLFFFRNKGSPAYLAGYLFPHRPSCIPLLGLHSLPTHALMTIELTSPNLPPNCGFSLLRRAPYLLYGNRPLIVHNSLELPSCPTLGYQNKGNHLFCCNLNTRAVPWGPP